MPDDEHAPTRAGKHAEITTDATGHDDAATRSHLVHMRDPADLGGESPCLAHLLDELDD